MRKTIICVVLVSVLLFSLIVFRVVVIIPLTRGTFNPAAGIQDPNSQIYMDQLWYNFTSPPPKNGAKFNVSVCSYNISTLYAYQLVITYNSSLLNCVNAWPNGGWDDPEWVFTKYGDEAIGLTDWGHYEDPGGPVPLGFNVEVVGDVHKSMTDINLSDKEALMARFEFEILMDPLENEELSSVLSFSNSWMGGTLYASVDDPLQARSPWLIDSYYNIEWDSEWMLEPIKIGVIGPMNTNHGQCTWEGATLAAEEINASGGVNVSGVFRPIELHSGMEYVNPDLPTESASEMERLITDVGVDFVIGGFRSENVFAMREVAMDSQKIFIITGAATNELVGCGDGTCGACVRCNYSRYKYLFRGQPVNGTQLVSSLWGFQRFVLEDKLLPLYGEYLWPGAPNKQVKVAVVSENCTWADVIHSYMTNQTVYPSLGVLGPYANVTYSARVDPYAVDFTAELQSVKDCGARLLIHLFDGMTEAGSVFIKQWAELGVEAVPVGIDVLGQDSNYWLDTDGKCEYETFLATSGTRTPINTVGPVKTVDFWDAYVERFGHYPVYPVWGAYDMIYTLRDAIERAETIDPDAYPDAEGVGKLVRELEATDRNGVTGKFKFTESHDVFSLSSGATWPDGYSRPFICQWQAGRLEVVWPADQAYSMDFKLPTVHVNVVPSTDVVVAGHSFTANITVSNVVDLCLWAFSVSWNPANLDLIDVTEGEFLAQGGDTTGVLIKEINQAEGYVKEAACSLLGSVPGVNGSGTLATLTFKATAVGSTPLDMYFCDLLNSTGETISFNITDGAVDIDAPELSISSVSLPYPDMSLYVNTTVTVNATIQNLGNCSAGAFNVSFTAYWNDGETVDSSGKLTVGSLESNKTRTLQFNFILHYTGNYTLTFKVDCDYDVIEVNETNNELNLSMNVKMQGDIDGDNEVTYLDLFDLSRAYWSTPEDANWDPYADINDDGRVDHNDLFLLAQNYSE